MRAFEHHEREGLRLVRLLQLGVRDTDHLVLAVAIHVDNVRRRRRPLEPHRLLHVGEGAGVQVVVILVDLEVGPPDELPPAQTLTDEHVPRVRVPGRCKDRRAVRLERVELVVVVSDEDLELLVVVDVADADVLAVAAVAGVSLAVEGRVAARVVTRPRVRLAAGREQLAVRGEHEHLRAGGRRVGGGNHDLELAVVVEIRCRHAAGLGHLPTARGARRPALLHRERAVLPLVGGDRAVVAAHHDLHRAIAVEIGDDVRRIHTAHRGRALRAERLALRVEHERAVERRDDLHRAVLVEIDDGGRREPPRLAGLHIADERRHLYRGSAVLALARRRRGDGAVLEDHASIGAAITAGGCGIAGARAAARGVAAAATAARDEGAGRDRDEAGDR